MEHLVVRVNKSKYTLNDLMQIECTLKEIYLIKNFFQKNTSIYRSIFLGYLNK